MSAVVYLYMLSLSFLGRMMTKEEFDALENDTAVAIRRSKARKGAFVTAEQAKKE